MRKMICREEGLRGGPGAQIILISGFLDFPWLQIGDVSFRLQSDTSSLTLGGRMFRWRSCQWGLRTSTMKAHLCSISKKGSSSCLTKHPGPCEIPQALARRKLSQVCGWRMWLLTWFRGGTSIRQYSNTFGMGGLSLFVFKSVHSQAVLLSPGGEVWKLQMEALQPLAQQGWSERKGMFTKKKINS